VRKLKGPNRPINPELDRAMVVAGLASVDLVCIFPDTCKEFLEVAKPDIWVKGGDYTLETLDQDERRIVEQTGRIEFIPFMKGRSTSNIISKLAA
jgi:D-glycero-beta-D-manno-heptose 1-phosphate adenylyltransferase